jgi:hypothetical protein|tara:strand:+ start:442 stop:567 length:126 start_codon:yes stop_codon:yes gene_type:complete
MPVVVMLRATLLQLRMRRDVVLMAALLLWWKPSGVAELCMP